MHMLEEQHRGPERMAVSSDTDVYLETMEDIKDTKEKAVGTGPAGMANTGVVKRALTKERLINWGNYDLATAYQSVHVNY